MSDELRDILSRRSSPGIAIFSIDGRLMYISNEALNMIPEPGRLIEDFKTFCKDIGNNPDKLKEKKDFIFNYSDQAYAARTFPINVHSEDKPSHLMILIERVTERREIDIKRAKEKYRLTKRELEIVKFISQGLSNKEIADKLNITENTVKDHIKNIMEKMDVHSRAEIIAKLK